MKKFFRFAAAAVAAFAIFSCEKTPDTPTPDGPDTPGNTDEPKVEYTENIEFELVVKEVEFDQVKVQVSHTGTKTDTWYYFATTETDIAKAVEDKVDELTAEATISGLKKTTKTTVTVRNLDPETEYNFVVFAITAEGDVYGTYNSTEFKTAKAPLEGYQVNPAWTVQYIGEGVADDEKSYDHVISVTSTDNNPYLTSVFTKAEFEQYGIEAVAESEIAYWTDYVNQFNQANGTNYDISALLYTGNVKEGWDLDAGEFVALAIGVNENGEASGYYAVSEPFSVVEAEMSDAYKAWLGDWTFTDGDGIALNVTFGAKSNNKTYNMFGFDAPELDAYPVEVTWMEEDGIWAIFPQNFGTFTFEDDTKGDIYFLGGQVTEEGKFSLYTDVPICVGGMTEDGSRVVMGYADEENGISISLMSHFVVMSGQPYFWADTSTIPWFPMQITPAAATSAVSVDKDIRWTSKKTMLPKPFKAYDFTKSAKASF